MLNALEEAGQGLSGEVAWLMAAAVAMCLIGCSFLIRTIPHKGVSAVSHPPGANMMLVSAALILMLPLLTNEALIFLGLTAIVILLPIGVTFWSYVNNPELEVD